MSLTTLSRPFFRGRQRQIDRYATEGENIQRQVLRHLIERAAGTTFGRQYDFRSIDSYEDFAARVPVGDYETHKASIELMRQGQRDVLWPGACKWFAKSSGTTSDRSKFIPVTGDGLLHLHYRGGRDAVALYLRNRPDARIFDGRSLILGGSFDEAPSGQTVSPSAAFAAPLPTKSGDLSAILIRNIPRFAELMRTPSREVALLADFEQKRDLIAQTAMRQNVVSLSGVPSWMMAVVKRVMEMAGTDNLADVWPNLEVFWHGGVAFGPYREQYRQMIRSPRMQYMETYNASEGFFGLQSDPSDPAMLLMLDYDCFYEFLPTDEPGEPVPLWQVEVGRNYAMLITTSCGLWRYQIGDTVRFTQSSPYKFVISGRTKCFINAFGEELMVDNAEKGLLEACTHTGLQVREYTAAPVFMDAEGKCRHQWLVEFATEDGGIPADQARAAFAQHLDEALRHINSDYDAKRYHDITLQPLEVIAVPVGTFDAWLKRHGKLGGQHKVPRLSNDRKLVDEILAML